MSKKYIFLFLKHFKYMKLSTKIYIVLFLITLVGGLVTSSHLLSAISVVDGELVFSMKTLSWVCLCFNIVNFVLGNILYFRFLKTRKYNSMLFFATAPLVITFGGIVFALSSLNNLSGKVVKIVKTALNVKTTNYNNYIWIGVALIVILILMFVTFSLLAKPVKKVEQATKKLSFGEVKDNINIGGNKQFLEIENSLNKINDSFKKKDEMIRQTNLEYQKIVPKQILKFLGKKSVLELELGSQVKKVATTLFCSIKNKGEISQSVSLEENFNYINSYHSVVSPIIRKFGGFIDKYINDGIFAVFASPESAYSCCLQITKTINQKNLEQNNSLAIELSLAIHTSEIIFGVVGDETQKSPTVISNSIDILNKINDINNVFGSTLIVTKDFLSNLQSSYKLMYRYIGNVGVDDSKDILSIFECLDIYPRQKRDKLTKCHIEFENAVRYYVNGKYELARDIFERVYKKEKDDKVCYIFYNKCCENLDGKCINLHE